MVALTKLASAYNGAVGVFFGGVGKWLERVFGKNQTNAIWIDDHQQMWKDCGESINVMVSPKLCSLACSLHKLVRYMIYLPIYHKPNWWHSCRPTVAKSTWGSLGPPGRSTSQKKIGDQLDMGSRTQCHWNDGKIQKGLVGRGIYPQLAFLGKLSHH